MKHFIKIIAKNTNILFVQIKIIIKENHTGTGVKKYIQLVEGLVAGCWWLLPCDQTQQSIQIFSVIWNVAFLPTAMGRSKYSKSWSDVL